MTNELDMRFLEPAASHPAMGPVIDAIDLASDQDQMTWVVSDGKRIAAIVPVDVAEAGDFTAEYVEADRLAAQGKRAACGGTAVHADHTFNQGTHCPGWPE